ncbi:TIGR03016 family PEP-CTERM system-associated outer membrane protein [Alicycliphilus denitrificans]|uniref:TIGR03016 family PEP-CTERM system-associated outer membrane protein n=1 Tax=Alicycliphilus denitrificans TaxID=179636 RepID=UPI00384B5DA7
MHLSHHRMANVSVIGCVVWVLAAMPALLPGFAAAQVPGRIGVQLPSSAPGQLPGITAEPMPGAVVARQNLALDQPHQSGIWLEPKITIQHTVTNNVRLDATQLSDQVTEVIPGFRLVSDTARIQGFVDYSLRTAHYARGTVSDQVWHNLNARGTVEAVEKLFFVDVDGIVALQPISAFGAPGDASPANPNMAQTSVFRISPYLRGSLSGGADYEVRYGVQDVRSDAVNRTNVTVQDWLLHLGRQPMGQVWTWGLDATQQNLDYSNGRNIDTTALRARVGYFPVSQLFLTGIVGVELTNHLTPVRESHNIVGFGIDWRPSERTRLFFERESRYFGESHNAIFEYKTPRTVWRYTDKKAVVTGLGGASSSMGSLFDLLDGFYARTEPNAIRRTQLVRSEIERMGLPASMQVFQDFLTSSSTLQRLQQMSLALLGQRSTLALAYTRTDTRLLDGALQLGDDFDTNQRILQRGWSLVLGHRLTQNSSINASLGQTRSVGTVPGLETKVRPLIFGWNTRVAPRTNIGIQLRRVLSDGSAGRYGESAIMGFITHRF